MRIYIILFFLASVIFASCKSETPKGILDQKQMADVLVDVHMIDGVLATSSQFPDSLYKKGMARYLQAFKQHQTDSTQFKRSFKYYTSKPDLLDAVYEDVINRFKFKTDSLSKVISKPQNAVSRK